MINLLVNSQRTLTFLLVVLDIIGIQFIGIHELVDSLDRDTGLCAEGKKSVSLKFLRNSLKHSSTTKELVTNGKQGD